MMAPVFLQVRIVPALCPTNPPVRQPRCEMTFPELVQFSMMHSAEVEPPTRPPMRLMPYLSFCPAYCPTASSSTSPAFVELAMVPFSKVRSRVRCWCSDP